MNVMSALTIALFCLAIGVPGLRLAITGPRDLIHTEEHRQLAPTPAWPRTREHLLRFPREVNAWLDDHFGFRPNLLRWHAHVLYYALRTSPSPKVLIGQDDFLFLRGQPDVDGDPITDFRGTMPLIPYQLERWRWQLEEQRAWLSQHGIDYYFAIIPSKASIYPDKLPRSVRDHRFPPTALEQFTHHLSRTLSFPILDLTEAFLRHRDQVQIYQRTDTHWTDDGGLIAVEEILRAMSESYPAVSPPPPSFWTRETFESTEGDLARMMGLTGTATEWITRVRPATPTAVVTRYADHPLTDIAADRDDPDGVSVLLFHDSFGHFLKPILPDLFKAIRFRWTNLGLEPHLVAEHRPDVVITLMAERRIRLGQRYPVEIQQAGAAALFQACEQVDGTWSGAELAGALQSLSPDVSFKSVPEGGLRVDAPNPVPHLQLPPIADADQRIPVLMIELESDYNGDLAMIWETKHPETWPGHHFPIVKAPLRQGFNRIYFLVIDPEMTGAAFLQFGPRGGRGELHRMEWRSRPRYEPLPRLN